MLKVKTQTSHSDIRKNVTRLTLEIARLATKLRLRITLVILDDRSRIWEQIPERKSVEICHIFNVEITMKIAVDFVIIVRLIETPKHHHKTSPVSFI